MSTRAVAALGAAMFALIAGSAAESRPAVCLYKPERDLRAQAQLIFNGVALPGPNADGELLSPARFRVQRYLKGTGAHTRLVRTRLTKLRRGGYKAISELIDPRAGQRWRIYGRRAKNGVVQTSICAGSRRLTR